MKKSDRKKVFDKYGGRCAYCGCELTKGWHVDEIEPIVRGIKYHYNNGKRTDEKYITYPERINIDNQNPACASCNIQKHSQHLEVFREQIGQFIESLNKYHSIYRFAKRYSLVEETGKPVVFYFEMLNRVGTVQGSDTTVDAQRTERWQPNRSREQNNLGQQKK